MQTSLVSRLDEIPASDWNRLCGPHNPFVRHEFLAALERNGCVGEGTGWLPRHLVVREGGRLIGAVPMYLKHHSFGEYVFDWAWADAYARYGLRYYPKLVVAVPYTPVTGPRLLSNGATHDDDVRRHLVAQALETARGDGVSSLHWLFTTPRDTEALQAGQLLHRAGCQFHWTNPGFRDFDDFLSELTSKRRKEVKRERRQALDSDLEVEIRTGEALGEREWHAFHRFYCATYDRKWGMPYLNLGFFEEIGRTMPESVLLILASRHGRYVAGALCFKGADSLFGRNWGSQAYYPSLHYEMCYYRTIDYCIRTGLSRFEAGAQGDYKVTRGLLPTATASAHWVGHPQFRSAIGGFIDEERREVERFIEHAARHSPFKARESGTAK